MRLSIPTKEFPTVYDKIVKQDIREIRQAIPRSLWSSQPSSLNIPSLRRERSFPFAQF